MTRAQYADGELAHAYGEVAPGQLLPIRPTILSSLSDHVRAQGNDPYLTIVSADGVKTMSYRELDVLSRRVAHHVRHEWRVRAGDVVGLIPASDAQSVVTIVGMLRSGCATLLLNPADPASRIRSQAGALSARMIVRSPRVAVSELPEAVPMPDGLTSSDEAMVEADAVSPPASPALFFGTSGSTAVSKLVAQSHYNAAVNAYAVSHHHGLRRGDRLLGCLPFHHVNGVHFTLLGTLAAGAHAVVVDSFDPFTYLDVIERFRPRLASVVPSILEALLDGPGHRRLPGEFNYFVSAAAPLTTRTARAVSEKLGARILQGYGLTETTNFSTTVSPDISEETYRRLIRDAEIPSIGNALYGNQIKVLKTDGSPAARGEIGELCVRGHNVMIGYACNPTDTAEAFRGGWFHSQDLGFEVLDRDSGRTFFVVTGRTKNIAKVGGEAVSLDEMERVLRALPRVRDAACISRPHRLVGDEIIAAVVSSDDVGADDLREHLRKTFAPMALPRCIVKLPNIPRTPTGKIRRAELTQQLHSLTGDRTS